MLARTRLRGGILAAVVALTGGPALADVKAGVDAWTGGDFAAAVAEWQAPAAQGDADAQFNLGQAYKLGRGVKQDLAKAEELFGKAAAQGHMQASDNFGLLLFQRGERAKALPFISAAADRGDPRSQYLLGIAHFNGDNVPKNWERAYALVSLAQQAGLPQAASALSQMDQYIPLAQRQASVPLARELASQAEATRARQLATADLGSSVPNTPTAPVVTAAPRVPPMASATVSAPPAGPLDTGAPYARPAAPAVSPSPSPRVAVANPPPAATGSPQAAGADFTRPRAPVAIAAPRPAAAARPAPPAPAANASGAWRVQLGAFGVPANAQAMWDRVKTRPEVAGRAKLLIAAGGVTKLQAGGYANEDAARAACSRLSSAGFSCLATRN